MHALLYGRCAALATACVLTWFAVWTLIKIPYVLPSLTFNFSKPDLASRDSLVTVRYMGHDYMTNVTYNASLCSDPANNTACYGPEAQASLRAWNGYRSVKLSTDYPSFIAPHSAMAVVLECLFVCLLVRDKGAAPELARLIVPLSACFALHVMPVAYGLPSLTINWGCIILIWGSCYAAKVGMEMRSRDADRRTGDRVLHVSLFFLCLTLNAAPLAEMVVLASPSGSIADTPAPRSGHGVYARCNCPFSGFLVSSLILAVGARYGFLGVIGAFRRSSAENDARAAGVFQQGATAYATAYKKTVGPLIKSSLDTKGGKQAKNHYHYLTHLVRARIKRGPALVQLYHFSNDESGQAYISGEGVVKGEYIPALCSRP